MLMIYSPQAMPEAAERKLEQALESDRARVHYVGNDGAEEFVIVEAADFAHTRKLERELNLSLSWQPGPLASLPDDIPGRTLPRSTLGAAPKTRRKRRPA